MKIPPPPQLARKNVKILVCCHKKDIMATEEPYMPIHVGKAISDVDLGIQGDDTGDNISAKNRSYCELTGMYWAWKNLKDVDVIGLCHYRRYFDFHNQARRLIVQEVYRTHDFGNLDLSVPANLLQSLDDETAVVARRKWWHTSLYNVYCKCFVPKDIKTIFEVIQERHPSYVEPFNYIMRLQNKKSQANMFIMTWHNFNSYCTWLFDILGEVEKRTDLSNYDPYQRRIYGFMGEFLLNVWLYANKIKQIRRPIIVFTDTARKPSQMQTLRRNIRWWFASKIRIWIAEFKASDTRM